MIFLSISILCFIPTLFPIYYLVVSGTCVWANPIKKKTVRMGVWMKEHPWIHPILSMGWGPLGGYAISQKPTSILAILAVLSLPVIVAVLYSPFLAQVNRDSKALKIERERTIRDWAFGNSP